MKKFIIAVDLDETLLDSNKQLSKYTIDTLKAFSQKGFVVAVSSARGLSNCYPFADMIGADYVCCQGGNMIVDKNQKILFGNPFPKQTVREVFDNFSKYTEDIVIDSENGMYMTDNTKQTFTDSKWNMVFCSVEEMKNLVAYKICIHFKPEWRGLIEQYANEHNFVCRKMRDGDYMLLTPANSDKYYALEKLMDIVKTDVDHLIVFGDDTSDTLSIEKAKYGVAVANSRESVLKCAKFVAPSNDEDGVAKFLNENFKLI